MHIRVAGTHHDAIVAIQQEIAVQRIRPRFHGEEDAEQSGARRSPSGIPPTLAVEFDVATHPIDIPLRTLRLTVSSIQFLRAI